MAVKDISQLIEKSVIFNSTEIRGSKVIALSKKKLRSGHITYTFIDENWMHRQDSGYFELPSISIVDYDDISI